MITNLGELLRATLDGSGQQKIPLRRELEFLDRYLDIQKVRFADRLRIEKKIDAGALEAEVPVLILQPLVENAIRHGIEPLEAPGVVGIEVRRDGEVLEMSVRDNGPGLRKPAKPREGIGLANTRARLQGLYGEDASLNLVTPAEGGFCAEIRIPWPRPIQDAQQRTLERQPRANIKSGAEDARTWPSALRS
jgi:LytS/YehU family sensor histidine kinase